MQSVPLRTRRRRTAGRPNNVPSQLMSNEPLSKRAFLGWVGASAGAAVLGSASPAHSAANLPVGATFNPRDFGAVGDGSKLDTAAIQAAIDAAANAGGGTVVLPPGTYLSGTLFLKSGVQ